MIGYIYKTTNLIDGKMYIGKHISSQHEPSYLGSGHILLKAIKAYGKQNFSNEIIATANSVEELDSLEKTYIAQHKKRYGENCYNLAVGGEGGNVFQYASKEKYQEFVDKMTQINKKRCSTDEFRQNTSRHVTLRYQDPEERKLQSKKIRKAWSNSKLKQQQSERVKEWHSHKTNYDYLGNECYIVFQGQVVQFPSIKKCIAYLKATYKFVPSNLDKCNPYKAFHNKHAYMNGLIFGYGIFQQKSVTTNPDECKDVEVEIGTTSKCETTQNELKR